MQSHTHGQICIQTQVDAHMLDCVTDLLACHKSNPLPRVVLTFNSLSETVNVWVDFSVNKVWCVTVKINPVNEDRCVSFLFSFIYRFIGSYCIHAKLREMVTLSAPKFKQAVGIYIWVYLWILHVIYRPVGLATGPEHDNTHWEMVATGLKHKDTHYPHLFPCWIFSPLKPHKIFI